MWERYRSKVEWAEAADYALGTGRFPGLAARGPDDVPVAAVFHVHGADGIVTNDRDLLDYPEIATVSRQLVQLVREYARAKATAVTATTLPTFAVTGVLVAAVGIFSAIPGRWRLVAFLIVVAIAVVVVVLMSTETRASIRAAFAGWLDWTTDAMSAVETAADHQTAIVRARCPRAPRACRHPRPAKSRPEVMSPTRRRRSRRPASVQTRSPRQVAMSKAHPPASLFQQLIDIYVGPEVERRRAAGRLPDDFVLHAAQLICSADAVPNRIRLNDEVQAIALVR